MFFYLRQSTASQSRMVGPFLDDSDFKTVETGLTIANTDVKLSKNGAAGVDKNSGGGTHRNNGMYSLTFDATDSDTVGELDGSILVSGALVVPFKAWVFEEGVYDALFANLAPGYLQPTTAGRSLDVTTGGNAGIDWGNIVNQSTSVDLSDTAINLCDTITTYTNNTVQSGDSFALIGTAGAGLTDLGGMSTGMQAEVQSECNDALVAINLDHLFAVAIIGTDVTDNSYAAKIVSPSVVADYDDYDNTTDSLPAISTSVGTLSVGSAAISTQSESYTLTTGTEASGTFADTATVDGVYHQHTDTAGAMELYYQFDVGGTGVAVEAVVNGRINSGNDDLDGVYAYDWGGAAWDRVGDFEGQVSSDDVERQYPLLTRHTGSGANLGKVRIRFYAAAGLTTATLSVDRIYASYSVVSQSVGYENGAVWIDTLNGSAGAVAHVNGTADNPVNNIADAISIASTVGLSRYEVSNGSSITFAESHDNETWNGTGWTLALGAQSISNAQICCCAVSGIATGASRPVFERCSIGNVTLPPCRINGGSGFTGTFTVGSAGNYDFIDCTSLVAGSAVPVLDTGSGIGASNFSIRDYSGGLSITNIAAGDLISLEGVGGQITVNGTGGEIYVRGIYEGVTDSSSAAVTITQIATLNRQSAAGYVADGSAVHIDTSGSNSGIIAYVDGTADNPVNNIADATTIASAIGSDGVRTFTLVRNAAITLAQGYTAYVFRGIGGQVALGGQDVSFCVFSSVLMTGTGTGTIGRSFWSACLVDAVTVDSTSWTDCSFVGTITLAEASEYGLRGCNARDAATAPVFDFGAAVGSTRFYATAWDGKMELQNVGQNGTDAVVIHGRGEITINANCTGGTIKLIGDFIVTDNGTSTVTLDDNSSSIVSILDDTVDLLSKVGTPSSDLATEIADIQSSVDGLNDFDPTVDEVDADMVKISGSALAADNQEVAALGIIVGAAVTGTLTTASMTTNLVGYDDDRFIGRHVVFTGAPLAGEETDITDYSSAGGVVTFNAGGITEAPTNGTTFVII